jgi:hypothetical protein
MCFGFIKIIQEKVGSQRIKSHYKLTWVQRTRKDKCFTAFQEFIYSLALFAQESF